MWSEHVSDLLACRGCLVTNVKLYNIHENGLVQPYEELIGIPVLSSDLYPQYLCMYCRSQLLQFLSFRTKCRKSQEVLRDFELTGKCITTQNISTIDRNYYQLTPNYVQTKTETIDYINNDQKIDNIVKQEDWINDYVDDDNVLHFTDHKIEIALDLDENVNKQEKDTDIELEQPIAIFVEDQKPFKREKVNKKTDTKKTDTKKTYTKKTDTKKTDTKKTCRKSVFDSDTDSSFELHLKFLSENDEITDIDSDSDFKVPIIKLDKPKAKRKKPKSKDERKVGGKKEATNDEIKELANSLDFDVHFLTKEEQYREVEERKMSDLDDRLIIKCTACGKNFRDSITASKHQKEYHDPTAGQFICEICTCRFKTNHRLLGHLRIHKMKFRCRSCDFTTKIRCNIAKHYDWHQGKRQTCPYCKRVFEKVSSYFSHIRLKHASELTWCDLCGESFIGENGVKAHQRRAHRNIKICEFKCKKCNTNFINEDALLSHEKSNRCDLSSCTKCGESFVSEKLLKYHLVQHHTENEYIEEFDLECERCKVKFQNAVALRRHGEVCHEGGFPCVQCGISCTTDELLNEHIIEKHTLEHTFTCEECNKTFSNAYYFRDHYSKMHLCRVRRMRGDRDGRSRRPLVKVKRRAKRGEFDNSIRKWRVVGEEAADVVMEKTSLVETGENKCAMCEVCGKSFINSGLLKYHQRIHTGEKPFECPHCSKKFTVKSVLMQHIRVHTGERPYACKHCPKAFKSPSALYRHNLVHSGVRRHVCQLCDKSFQTSTCVKLHIKTVHMKLPMPPRNRRRNRVKDE